MAEAIQEAYSDLFAVNTKANELTIAEVKNKFRTLTQGKTSEKVVGLMANTFKALVDYAEWGPETKKAAAKKDDEQKAKEAEPSDTGENTREIDRRDRSDSLQSAQLHYNIQTHLPDSRDQAVYDAIFKSLKQHLF